MNSNNKFVIFCRLNLYILNNTFLYKNRSKMLLIKPNHVKISVISMLFFYMLRLIWIILTPFYWNRFFFSLYLH